METNITSKSIAKFKNKLKSKFIQNLLTLGFGTLIAQSIPIIASPILTRLFTPSDFGVFATFTAMMAVLLVFYSGKFELSIILPKTHKEAINILGLCFALIIILSLFFELTTLLWGNIISDLLNYSKIKPWLWLVPVGAFFASIYLVLNEWYIRKENFKGLSKNKIGNTTGITLSSLIFGILNFKTGLILGQVFGQVFSVALALKRMLLEDKNLVKYISIKKMKYFAIKYVNFAKFNIPGQLINTIAGQLPIFILTSKFGFFEAGLYAFTDRILGVPMSFVGNSFKDVFKQRAAIEYKEKGNCLEIYKKVTFSLIGLSIVPFMILFITAPMIFTYVFGHEWYQAGVYARVLCVMYMLSFVSMPTGWIFVITENQKLDFVWQIIFFIFTVIPLLLGIWMKDAFLTILFLGIGRSISYSIQIYMTYQLAKK